MDRPGSVSLVSQVCEMRVGDGGLWGLLGWECKEWIVWLVKVGGFGSYRCVVFGWTKKMEESGMG